MDRRCFLSSLAAAVVPLPSNAAPSWVAAEFMVMDPYRYPRMEQGFTWGYWGVRQYRVIPSLDWEGWNITHLPTGFSVGLDFDSRDEAMRAAERIDAEGDFRGVTERNSRGSRLAHIVRQIRAERAA